MAFTFKKAQEEEEPVGGEFTFTPSGGPVAPEPDPAMQFILRRPGDPVAKPSSDSYGHTIATRAKEGLGNIALAGMGHEAAMGGFTMPRGDRPVTAQRRLADVGAMPEVREKASRASEKAAVRLQQMSRDIGGTGMSHDIAGAVGSGAAPMAGGLLAGLLAGPKAGEYTAAWLESAQEQGAVQKELMLKYDMPADEAYKKSLWVFGANLPLNALLNKGIMRILPDEGLLKRLKAAGGTKAMAKLIAKETSVRSAMEGVQEGIQENISSLGVDKELAPLKETGYSALLGTIVGAGGNVASSAPAVAGALEGGIPQDAKAIPTPQPVTPTEKAAEATPSQDMDNPEIVAGWAQEARQQAQEEREAGREDVANDLDEQADFLEEEAYKATDIMDMSPEDRRNAPIEGVPFSDIASRYLRGKITINDLFAGMREAVSGQTGAITDDVLSATRAKVAAERKAARELDKANKGVKGYQKADMPSMDAQAIWARALPETLSPEARAELRTEGAIGDVTASALRDKRRTIEDVVMKRRLSTIKNNTQRLGEMMEMLRGKLEDDMVAQMEPVMEDSGIKKGSKTELLLGEVLYNLKKTDDPVAFFTSGKGQELFSQVPVEQQEDFVMTSLAIRDIMAEHLSWRNEMAKNFGGNEFDGLDAYFPKREKQESWIHAPLKRWEQFSRPARQVIGEDKGSATVRSPRERRRTGKDYDLDFRVWSVMEDYIGDTARRVAYQPVVSASKAISSGMEDEAKIADEAAKQVRKQIEEIKSADGLSGPDVDAYVAELEQEHALQKLRAEGMRNSANAVNAVMQSSYNNVAFGKINQMIQGATSASEGATPASRRWARAAVVGVKGAAATKRMFNRAKYKMNIPFIVLRQWTSSGQAWGFEGVRWHDVISAWGDVFASLPSDVASKIPGVEASSRARELNLGTYTGAVKSGTQGRMTREGEGGMRKARLGGRGFWGTLDELTDRPTAYMEEVTGRFSASLANRVADNIIHEVDGKMVKGLDGRARNDFLSDVTAQMQSEYHNESRAEALRNPVLNALLPAQSFALEMGQNLTRAQKADKLRLLSGMLVANLLYQFANNYRDFKDKDEMAAFGAQMMWDVLLTAVPWSSQLVGGGPSKGDTYTASLVEDLWDARGYLSKAFDEDISQQERDVYLAKAASDVVKNVLPTGGQISRAIMADVMFKKGLITEEEIPQAAAFGWWTTDSGHEYLRRLNGLSKKNKEVKAGRRTSRQTTRTAPRRSQ